MLRVLFEDDFKKRRMPSQSVVKDKTFKSTEEKPLKHILIWAAISVATGGAASATTLFVASYGSDSNNCGEFAPCATFAHAALFAGPGGTVIALDSADFGNGGTLNLHSPVTIDGGGHGAMLVGPNGAPAINLSLGSSANPLVLRNINIVTGIGDNSTAISGYVSGSQISLEHVSIVTNSFGQYFANGIQVQLDSYAQANLKDVTVTGGVTCVNFYPLVSATEIPFSVSLEHVIISGCGTALQIQDGNVTVRNSTLRGSAGQAMAFGLPAAPANTLIENSQITNNAVGISALAPYTIRFSNSVFSNNTTAVQGTATFVSYRNNVFAANGADGPISLSTSLK